MTSLHEKYRPREWRQFVGQEKAVAVVSRIRQRGLGGRVFWIRGQSGSGKTTIARLIASEISEGWAILELDAQDVSLEVARELEEKCRCRPIGCDFHVFIVNESHGLSSRVITRLLTSFERDDVSRNSTWIFTATREGEKAWLDGKMDMGPFLSRCMAIDLDDGEVTAAADRCRKIAEVERLGGPGIADYVALAHACKGNFRLMLQRIEAGEMQGERHV